MIGCIINIRFTNQYRPPIFVGSDKSGGQTGWPVQVAGGQGIARPLETAMSAITDISRAASPPGARLAAAIVRTLIRQLRRLADAFRNRNDASVLAGLDDRMLADIGITRSDVRDALAEPLWRDPTNLLRARALERRLGRHASSFGLHEQAWLAAPPLAPTGGVRYPATDRPARFMV